MEAIDLSSLSASSLALGSSYGKINCERNWKMNRSSTPFPDYDLWYIWSGVGEMTLNGEPYKLSRNQCFLFRPGDRVDAAHNPDFPLLVTYIHFSLHDASERLMDFATHHTFASPFSFEAYLERFVHVMTIKEMNFDEEAQLLLMLILLSFEREGLVTKSTSKRSQHQHFAIMTEIAASIRENPGNVGTIAALADRAYLSPRYFSMKFKEVLGQTIESYIIEKKIERAEYLLREHGMSVGEVADALGYQNIYYFSKQFKKVTGYNPSRAGK